MKYAAIDIETANKDMASICQIGIAVYENHELVEEFCSYIAPEDYFDDYNISIHGISEKKVSGAPTYPEITDRVNEILDSNIAICHTHFDRVSLSRVCDKYAIRTPDCIWLDSARIARRTWHEVSSKNYGLANVCRIIGYDFTHHDALEDAKAAARIVAAASEITGLDLSEWLKRVQEPIDPTRMPAKREGNHDGPLFGEVIVFTGALEIPRSEAADMAAQIGCEVGASVTKKTTHLVVGDQDISKLAGHKKSSKHRKAEELIAKGIPIRIIKESDFKELVSQA